MRFYFYLGRYQDAILSTELILAAKEIELENASTRTLAFAAMSYNALGESKKADEIVSILEDKLKASILGGSPAYRLAMIYSHKSNIEKAFAYLEMSYQDHEIEMYHLKTEPSFQSLYNDRRWQQMLDKVGFPD